MSVAVIACGAIATHISHITDSHGLDVTIYPLPPLLHNQPAKIAGEVEKTYLEIKDKHSKCAVAYADCGTYGALDTVIKKLGLKRLVRSPKPHHPPTSTQQPQRPSCPRSRRTIATPKQR